MPSTVSIVMYHYVRDMKRTRFSSIRGRTIDEFRFQVDYLRKTGTFISARQLIDAVLQGADLPENALMLSFDDGYLDHFTNVFPILHERCIEGMFFPAAQPIIEGRVMDTNKIHFILASEPDTGKIIENIKKWVTYHQDDLGLASTEYLWHQYGQPSEYDPAEVRFIKLVLQRGLPRAARNSLVDMLFRRYVTEDEVAFSAELYMSMDQLRMMSQCGQYVGSHGFTHEWFDVLGPDGQEVEIRESLRFLAGVGAITRDWIMCYPYGCYPFNAVDDNLRRVLGEHACALALTDHGGVADVRSSDRYMLTRIDTNELPNG
jgi:peptidoglycan/xylan/chitin deacetylase (PgdA/CDA1 family)